MGFNSGFKGLSTNVLKIWNSNKYRIEHDNEKFIKLVNKIKLYL